MTAEDRTRCSLLGFGLALVAALTICCSTAFAAQTHPYTGVSFGPDGVGGSEEFQRLQTVTVDAASGDIYAYDGGAAKIYKFDEAGNPVNFSALSGNAIENLGGGGSGAEFGVAIAPPGSPGGTAGDIYVANNGEAIQVYAPSGTKLGEVGQGAETCGVAVDPSGNLYAGVYSSTINRYTPDANPPTNANKVTGTVEQGICNVAVDGLGNIYAANFGGGGLFKLEDIADTTPVRVDARANSMTIAPDSNDLYADREGEVVQYDSTGGLVGSFGEGEISGSHGLAVNAGATKIYVATPKKVKIFGPTSIAPDVSTEAVSAVTKTAATLNGTISAAGGPPATCVLQYTTAEQFSQHDFEGANEKPCSPGGPFTGDTSTAVSANLTDLAIETEYVFHILGSNENGFHAGRALRFTTPGAVNLATGGAMAVAADSAILNGTINPEGIEVEECFFEYGETDSYGSSVPCAETPAEISNGSSIVAVHADLDGLEQATEYHFRLVGKNEIGTSEGEDKAFKTLAPKIEAESLAGVGPTSALLQAVVNPNGEQTTYRFQYVTEAEYQANEFAGAIELPEESIGAGATGVAVGQEVVELAPRTTYYVRVIAENGGGRATGQSIRLTTLAESASGLPDRRAYEQATPVDKDGGNAQGEHREVRTSPAGNGISFIANGGIPGAEGAQGVGAFLSLRGQGGWSTQGLMPSAQWREAVLGGLSEDLSADYAWVAKPGLEHGILEISTSNRQYTSIVSSSGNGKNASKYVASSADNAEALFELDEAITPGAAQSGYRNLYLWDRESQRFILAGTMNDGQAPEEGVAAGAWDWFNSGGGDATYYLQEENAISTDGSKVFFTDLANGQLYVRVNPTASQSVMDGSECTEPDKACTLHVSASQRDVPDSEGAQNAKFLTASADGSKVFFMSTEKLTNDANTGSEDETNDLYSFDTKTHDLTDLTASTSSANPRGGEVAGILGTSRDGSYVYFAAGGVLAPGATAGQCPYFNRASGICNIYLWHAGTTTLVARLEAEGSSNRWLSENWAPADAGSGSKHSARVSPDGKTLVFYSATNLTSFDSQENAEFYRYEIGDSQLACISCVLTGEAPRGSATFESITPGFLAPRSMNARNTRNLSVDGNRVFFESPDRLVSTDTNGSKDVYEWEANGTGSCSSEDQNGGCLYLISSGTSPQPSFFGDSSDSGNDVFFFTTQPLVGQDQDQLVDIYDARVDGGITSQNPAPPSICSGEACRRGSTGAPVGLSPGTSTFSGPGNPPKKKHRSRSKRHKGKAKHRGHHHGMHHEGGRNQKREGNR
jgi:hypothetical protein